MLSKHTFYKGIISLFLLLSFGASAAPSDHFVIKVNTILGVAAGMPTNRFTIPTSGVGYNYRVDWNNDGTFDDVGVTGDISHIYPAGPPFIHTIRIAGDLPSVNFNKAGYTDGTKLISIDQWGTNPWGSMFAAFQNASNVVNNASDVPNLSNCNLLNHMFDSATKIGQGNANWDWDTSSITQMTSMFASATSFNENLNSWDFGNVTNMSDMFTNVTLLTFYYEQLLISLNTQTIANGIQFGGGNSRYCTANGRNAHFNLKSFDNMIIDDGGLCEEGYFITTWKTNNPGSSNNTSITIPTDPAQTFYNYQVDWNGDGDFDDADENIDYTSDATHDYGLSAPPSITRTVKIKGHFPAIFFQNGGDKEKILSIEQWGTGQWNSMNKAFLGAVNLTMDAQDTPNLNAGITMFAMFENVANLGGSIGNWSWDTSDVVGMENAFKNAVGFDEDLSVWDVSSAGNLGGMFTGITLSTVNYDAILNGWAQLSLQNNVNFGAGNSIYCAAATSRQNIIDTNMWGINDGGQCNTNQAPGITTSPLVFTAENTMVVVTVEATDPENDTIVFSVSGGADMALFSIDSVTGDLSFNVAPDFETPHSASGTNAYVVQIAITEVASGNLSTSATFAINVTNVNEAPTILTAASISSPENQLWTQVTLASDDPEGGIVNHTITGGADADKFNLSTNDLFFNTEPDFENPGSAAGTNVYTIEITGTDTGIPELSDTKTFTITVTDVLEYQPEDLFKTTWKTDNSGTSNSSSITVPADGPYMYDYHVDWDNDGVFDEFNLTGPVTHDFNVAGTYTIGIGGNYPHFDYPAGINDIGKLLSIDQWGTFPWKSMFTAFAAASRLVIKATDTPNLTNCSSLKTMFFLSSKVGGPEDTGNWNWNTSNIDNMSNMFRGVTTFNQDLSTWNIENVTNMTNMFNGVTLSSTNYDALLISWDAQNAQASVVFGGGNSKYCSQAATDARQSLIDNDLWTITDGGRDPSCIGNDMIFANGFEDVVIIKTADLKVDYDFSKISTEDLNDTILLIIKGLDNQDNENLQIHLRNDLEQLQIRLSNKVDGQWQKGVWQDVHNTDLTTLEW